MDLIIDICQPKSRCAELPRIYPYVLAIQLEIYNPSKQPHLNISYGSRASDLYSIEDLRWHYLSYEWQHKYYGLEHHSHGEVRLKGCYNSEIWLNLQHFLRGDTVVSGHAIVAARYKFMRCIVLSVAEKIDIMIESRMWPLQTVCC